METEGDEAFRDFVAARYAALVRTGFLLTGDRGLAEDLVQSALIRMYGAWGRLDDPTNAEAYTRRTMLRLAGRWRQRRWRGEIPTEVLPESVVLDRSAEVAVADDVRRALLQLPFEQRAVLVLRFFDDRTESQTAELLGCSVGTVKSRSSRGLAALRNAGLLDDREEVEP